MALTINPLSETFGAEIVGADLSRPIDDSVFAEIRRTLLDRQVVVVREQELSAQAQIAFSARFGPLEEHDNKQYLLDGHREILVLSNERRNGELIGVPDAGDAWHTDLQFKQETALCTLLHAIKLPDEGGDTEFADLYAAYDTLPSATRERIATLKGVHTINKLRNPRVSISAERADAKAFYERQDRERPDVLHPIVRTHPETGRKSLYVSPRFTIGIDGLPEDEGQALLDELIDHALQPRFVYRHRWQPGDFLFWDNRCVLHRACGGYVYPDTRTMHRTTVLGDAPY